MADKEVWASETRREQFVSAKSCKKITRARQSVVKHAKLKKNTDTDLNDNETIILSPGQNEEQVTLQAIDDEVDEADDVISVRSNSPTSDTSEKASDNHYAIEDTIEETITQTRENVVELSPTALLPKATDEIDGKFVHFFETMTVGASKFFGKVARDMKGAARIKRHKQHSIEGPPENNVHLMHRASQQWIHLGLHIDEHTQGCRISRVIEDSIACQFQLQENDIIIKVNGFCLGCKSLAEIISYFAKIDITETFILTIRRQIRTGKESIAFIDLDVHVTIKLSDDTIDFEVEIKVTSQKLKYDRSTDTKYISQMPPGQSIHYLRVDGESAYMDTSSDSNAMFRMELYKGGSDGRRVCVMRNQTSSQVIDKDDTIRVNDLLATNAPRPGKDVISPDTKFFYWQSHPNYPGEDVFESVTKRGYYITSSLSTNRLVLTQFSSIKSVDSNGRFQVIDVK